VEPQAQAKFREFLAGLLDGKRDRLVEIMDEVLERKEVTVSHYCAKCRMQYIRSPVQAYNLKEIGTFLRLLADFGVSKPKETEPEAVSLSGLSEAELDELLSVAE
jgi:hypothetical protein